MMTTMLRAVESMMSSSSYHDETFARFLQQHDNNGTSNYWNHTHVPHQPHHQPKEDEDVPIVLKILAAAWMVFMLTFCYKAEQRELQEDARREEQRRRRREQRIRQRKFAPGRRQMAVLSAIVTKKMTDSSGAGVMDQGDDLQEDNEDMTCTICLEPFEAGQDLSFSRGLKCHHCFHRDCLVPWMMRNDDCPMCRTRLVDDDGKDALQDFDFDDDDEDMMEGRFRIVNGLVRFVSMLGHDRHRRVASFGSNGSEDVCTTDTTEGVVDVIQEVEMTNVTTLATPAVESKEGGTGKKGGKKKRRKGDRRNYSALSVEDNSHDTTNVDVAQQQQQQQQEEDDDYQEIV